jgi:hypothetical protein
VSRLALRCALLALLVLAGAGRARAAVIEGRISHPTKPGAVAHLDVQAIGLDEKQTPIERMTHTDANGHYRFDDLPSPAAYLVRARYGALTFPGGTAAFRQGEGDKRETLDFSVYDASSDAGRLHIAQQQWVIERSAGLWHVRESATIANPDATVVTVPPGAPAPISVAILPRHGEVSTAFGRLPEGAEVRGDVVEVRGPVLPGDDGFALQLEYDVEASASELATELATPSTVTELALYVQDFGVDIDAGELHPARSVRDSDVNYQSFFGFDVPAGTRLPLRIRALPPVETPSPYAVAAVIALFAGALFFFVAAPAARGLLRTDSPEVAEESPAKATLAAALRDLEHDFETGKLSPEDRDRMRDDLRREAVQALARERALTVQAPAPKPCECGRMPATGDLFCAACGRAL